ncbi:unnamed protein product, partial [Staurois parvus]
DFAFQGRRTVCKQNSFPLSQLLHTALHGCSQHSHTKQCAHSEAKTHGPIVKTLPAQLTL